MKPERRKNFDIDSPECIDWSRCGQRHTRHPPMPPGSEHQAQTAARLGRARTPPTPSQPNSTTHLNFYTSLLPTQFEDEVRCHGCCLRLRRPGFRGTQVSEETRIPPFFVSSCLVFEH